MTNLLTVTFTLSVMFVLSWQITLAALALLPLFVLPARWFGRKLQTITRESYNLNAAMNNTMTERFNVAGAMLVKLFGRPREEDAAFEAKAGRVRDIGVTQSMYGGVFFASLMLVASLGVALVYGWGGWLAAKRELDVGTVVALGAYLTRLYGPLTALSNVNVSIMTALVSFERVFEVLDLPPMIDDAPDAVDLPAGANTIEFDHVEFGYPAASEVSLASLESVAVLDTSSNPQVLHDVSFKADAGQLIALVGPSGAGKTTISALVSRLYDVTGGAVLIGGVDVRQVTQSSLRDTVGVVTQDSHMFHDTIRANLVYAKPDATDDELIEACKAAQIWDLVSSLNDGLDTLVGERGYRLSGGEKQRLAIARLLLKAPAIVVLDEATAHLDSESEAAVQRALKIALVRPHVTGDRPPVVDDPRRRSDSGDRRRSRRRARSPRRAVRFRWSLRRALPHPVRTAGNERAWRPRSCRRRTGAVGLGPSNVRYGWRRTALSTRSSTASRSSSGTPIARCKTSPSSTSSKNAASVSTGTSVRRVPRSTPRCSRSRAARPMVSERAAHRPRKSASVRSRRDNSSWTPSQPASRLRRSRMTCTRPCSATTAAISAASSSATAKKSDSLSPK